MLSKFFLLSSVVSLFALSAHGQQYVPGEVIVKLKNGLASANKFQFMGKAQSEKEMQLKRSFGKLGVYHYGLRKGQTVDNAIADLMNDPDVEYAEPNYIIRKASTSEVVPLSDAELQELKTEEDALPLSATAEGSNEGAFGKVGALAAKPVIAVIDTGLDITHPVFSTTDALWVNSDEIPGNGIDDDGNGYIDDTNGWNFVSNSGAMIDDDGHGTHVAGITLKVDADMDITSAPYGTAKYQIMPLKFLDADGVGSTSDAINAIYYAINNGANILNNSWGGNTYSVALHDAIVASYDRGVVFVAAAGNSGTNNDNAPLYPASYVVPHIMSVAATTSLDGLAGFSNFGSDTVDMGSLGQSVYSTIPGGGYGFSSGTSMSTPYVSGLAALMLIEQPSMLGFQVKNIIFNGADNIASLNGKTVTEARMNAGQSVTFAKVANVDASQPEYTGDRAIASASADGGGGCGLIAEVSKMGGPGTGVNNLMMMMGLAFILIPLAMMLYMRNADPANRRKHERFSVNTQVSLNAGGQELVGSISSMSMGGVQVDTEALLEQGGVVSMKISNPQGGADIEVTGKVVWSEAQKSYGVKFAKPKKTALNQLSALLSGLG